MVCTCGRETSCCSVLGLEMFCYELCCFGLGEECVEGDIELDCVRNTLGRVSYGVIFYDGHFTGEMSRFEGHKVLVYGVI